MLWPFTSNVEYSFWRTHFNEPILEVFMIWTIRQNDKFWVNLAWFLTGFTTLQNLFRHIKALKYKDHGAWLSKVLILIWKITTANTKKLPQHPVRFAKPPETAISNVQAEHLACRHPQVVCTHQLNHWQPGADRRNSKHTPPKISDQRFKQKNMWDLNYKVNMFLNLYKIMWHFELLT